MVKQVYMMPRRDKKPMPDAYDLVALLRQPGVGSLIGSAAVILEAADEIERLRVDNERMREELDKVNRNYTNLQKNLYFSQD